MAAHTRALVSVSAVLLVYWLITTAIAIDQGWPAEFGSVGDPTDVAGEWVSRGTLLSPPLVPMLAQGLFTLLALARRRGWRIVAGLGLAALGVLYTIGGLGEPLDPEASNPPVALYAALRVAGLVGCIALAALAVATVMQVIRAHSRGGR